MAVTARQAAPRTVQTVPTSRARTLSASLGAGGIVAAMTVVLNRTGGHDLGPLATCWFHAGTGLYCPFCGSLRAVAALSRGDVLAALHDNAPVMVLLGLATLVWGRGVAYAVAGRAADQPRLGRRATVALGVLLLLFAIYRNTPYGGWLAPLG